MINSEFRDQNRLNSRLMLVRPKEEKDPMRFIILSMEGKTEKCYFSHLNTFLKKFDVKINFHTLQHDEGENTPRKIYNYLVESRTFDYKKTLTDDLVNQINKKNKSGNEFSKNECIQILEEFFSSPFELKKSVRFNLLKKILFSLGIDIEYRHFLKECNNDLDSFAVVFDCDCTCPSHSKDEIESIRNENNKNIELCMSNPCFEFWLYLHLKDVHSKEKDGSITPLDTAKAIENKRVTDKHSYMSNFISVHTSQNKKISSNAFSTFYAPNISYAMKYVEQAFKTDFPDIYNNLGSNIGVFLKKIEEKYKFSFENLCELLKKQNDVLK